MYYNSQLSDVYCTMVDLSKAYDRIITSLICDKTRETVFPEQVNALIDFMGKNNFVCKSNWGQLNDECNVKNGERQGSISSHLDYYLNSI